MSDKKNNINMTREKIKISKKLDFFNDDILIGNIDTVLSNLSNFKEQAIEKGYDDISLVFVQDYTYHEICCFGKILENDLEFEKRMKDIDNIEKLELKKLERERKKYESLKKKFEN